MKNIKHIIVFWTVLVAILKLAPKAFQETPAPEYGEPECRYIFLRYDSSGNRINIDTLTLTPLGGIGIGSDAIINVGTHNIGIGADDLITK